MPTLRDRGRPRLALPAFVFALTISFPFAALAEVGDCGQPLSADTTHASDCLFVLRTAVELNECALCTCDVNNSTEVTASDALRCLQFSVGQNVTLDCPECASLACPGTVIWTTHAAVGAECETNAECGPGTCDPGFGRCRTATELDFGWSGTAHDTDLNEGSELAVLVDCNDDAESCGSCEILGVDASTNRCRCANDSRKVCDDAFETDSGCPACSGGAFAGRSCAQGSECVGGPCIRHCALDPEIECTTNGDCPIGRRFCADQATCGDSDGISCQTNDDCVGSCTGAAQCECWESPPVPVASVEFPFCIAARLAGDLSGTVDVDSGASAVSKDLELVAYGGLSLLSPCPVCGGTCTGNPQVQCSGNADCSGVGNCTLDATPNDGIRGGVCIGGESDGLSCDVGATNASFPARPGGSGGGAYSLDCMPEPESSFTGEGLRIHVVEGTQTSTLEATKLCDPTSQSIRLCPCLVCSGSDDAACNSDEDCAGLSSCSELRELACDSNADCSDFDFGTCTVLGNTRCSGSVTTPCTTNDDCSSVDFGTCDPATCSSPGQGAVPKANGCTSQLCDPPSDGEASCTLGPDDQFCDALVSADGSGIRACITNEDCSAELLGFNAGNCSLVERRECFADPITAEGSVNAEAPLAAATFCVPPATSIGHDLSLGLPGPSRLLRQTTMRAMCASDPEIQYVPQGNACP